MKKYNTYIAIILSTIVCAGVSSCKQVKDNKTNAVTWQVFGDTLKFMEYTYDENKQEVAIAANGAIIGIVDYDKPLDSTYLPLKVKTYMSGVDGKKESVPHNTLKNGITVHVPVGTIGLNKEGNRLVVLDRKDDSSLYLITYNLKGNKWHTADTLFLDASFNFNLPNLKLSNDGRTLAMFPAINHYTKAYVKTYRYKNDTWEGMGDSIAVQNDFLENTRPYGNALHWDYVDFDTKGSTLIIGNPFAEVNGPSSGKVQSYHYKNGYWTSFSKPIYGKFPYHHFGSRVHYGDKVLTVGATSRKFDDNMVGFELNQDNWKEKTGYFSNSQFIGDVYAVASDGNALLTMRPNDLDNDEYPKEIWIYTRIGEKWQLLGAIKNGSRTIKEFQLSSDKTRLITLQKDYIKQYIVTYKYIEP